ncbi:uncharacterized protein LOC110990765 [Acanthaster planci]|uniref:Uncharacterized protein LOC110990765 n=1 Tax=Acanthaster planci TaxID=133434 RepID=A0A8B8A3Q1_ACAPL|nr:uncharacterized protein LOC110990765 [Acanthaster planci]
MQGYAVTTQCYSCRALPELNPAKTSGTSRWMSKDVERPGLIRPLAVTWLIRLFFPPFLAEPISVGLVVGVCSAFLMAVVLVVIIFCRIKKSIRKFPAIRPPSLLRAENDYLSENRNHIMVREPEEFDDLIPCQLFVDLGPKEKDMVDIDIITDGFDIGDKPRGTVDLQNDVTNFDDHPLLSFKGDPMLSDAPLASEPLLPSPRREEDPSSGEEYNGAGPSSPVSVGSGGSYLHIRDDDELTYSCMTKDGLSPVQKEDIEGQRVRGESSQASAPRPQVDGLPLLLWRQESSNPDDDYPGDGDAIDSYLQMSRSVPPCTGPRPVREDPGRDRASSQGAELSKAPSKGAKGKERGDSAGASCVNDGTVLDYVQQGFVPGAAASSDRMYSPSESPADAYSQMGLRGGARATAALCDSTGSSSQDSAGPSQSQARQETGGAEATRGQGSRSEEDVNGAGIDSYVHSAFDRPHVRTSQEPSQCTVDSSNPPRDRASLVSLGATAPCAPPVSETTPTNKPPGATNIARTQSADALSDDSEEGALNYVRVGLDSDGIDVESMNGVEPANVNGYVVQGMLPNMSVPPMARNVAGEAMHSAAPSGYVDQAQLSNLSPPPSAQPATHSDHIHMNGTVGGSSGGGYITAAQMSNIAPLDPEVAFAEESPSNNNNNNRGQENVVAEPLVLQNESRLETDNLANVTQQEATGLLSGNLGVVPSTAITDDGVVPNGPVGPGSYVTTDQLTNLPLRSPQPNCHANRDAGK